VLERHTEDHILVIGQYIEQLERIAHMLNAPLITGKTPNQERSRLYSQFKTGEIKLLVVSRVANFAIDLPDANVAVQVSGLFGSRQEEAQRLGRILRPKSDGQPAYFYSIVTRDTKDQDFAANRQLFLTEQGYRYTILDASELMGDVEEGQFREIGPHALPAPAAALPEAQNGRANQHSFNTEPDKSAEDEGELEEAAEFEELKQQLEQSWPIAAAPAAVNSPAEPGQRSRSHLRVVK
jgi:superfamily II DNA or RNA helicase